MAEQAGRRRAMGVALAGAGGVLAVRAADAQSGRSTWETVTETKVLRLGAPISEAFLFRDLTGSDAPGAVRIGGTVWRGFSVNCAKELAEALGVELRLVETTYGNAIAGLQANQFDMIIGLDGTVRRAAAVDFVPQGLFMYGTAVLVREGTDVSTWQAINSRKLRIGVPVGTTMESEISRRAPDAPLDRFQSINEMISAFNAGRVQAISSSLTSMTLTSARIRGTVVAMPTPQALFPATAAIRQEPDPRWRNFLTTAFGYLAYSGFVQTALNETYAFRGVDIAKLPPAVIR